MSDSLEQPPTELVDFASLARLSRNIDISERVTYGNIALGTYRHRPHEGTLIGTVQHAVLINEGNPFDLEWQTSDVSAPRCERIGTGAVQIHPSDALVYKYWKRPSRMLFFAVDQIFVQNVLDDVFGGHRMGLKPNIGFRDSVISGMAEVWREELRQRGAGGRVYAEAMATTLIIHLFRAYTDNGVDIRPFSGGMNASRLNRVVKYIEEHIAEDMSLLTLAGTAGLSVHHFKQIFKEETGKAPHKYLIERRIHHAKEMLLGTNTSLAQIALAVGFSDQSHFTLNFRKLTGTTPMRFRLARKLGLIRDRHLR